MNNNFEKMIANSVITDNYNMIQKMLQNYEDNYKRQNRWYKALMCFFASVPILVFLITISNKYNGLSMALCAFAFTAPFPIILIFRCLKYLKVIDNKITYIRENSTYLRCYTGEVLKIDNEKINVRTSVYWKYYVVFTDNIMLEIDYEKAEEFIKNDIKKANVYFYEELLRNNMNEFEIKYEIEGVI